MTANSSTSATADREIAATRVFNAPRALVWSAWADPEHIAQWWGPNGFTTTTSEFDLRPGGKWLFTMHGPDGTDYRNEVTFTAVAEPELIEYEHGPSPVFQVSVRFEEDGADRTKLSMRMVFPTKAERDRTVEKFKAIEGQQQTLDRLERYLASREPK